MKKKLWGGRFRKEMAPDAIDYTETTAIDNEMFFDDVWGSEAHVIMLAASGVISNEDLKGILTALQKIKDDFESGAFVLDKHKEDVHMNVESFVIGQIGDRGKRMHTARSRNDQVITDTKIHVRGLILDIHERLLSFQKLLLDFASQHVDTITVGYTHTQHAQPISLGFWATAYVSMFMRDSLRLEESYNTANTNPLGACALSGTSFPTDRRITTRLLGFDSIQENSLDAVSSRDFALQLLVSLSNLMTNLSKMAEEMVYWSTFEFGTIESDDSYAHGSSIMPQKKNSDNAELIRGKAGRIYGLLFQMLTTMKGIPTGYNRDLQEDKPPLWEAARTIIPTLVNMEGIISTMAVNKERMRHLADANFSTATELADYLVKTLNMPFRECHRVVGELVRSLIDGGHTFQDIGEVKKHLHRLGVDASETDLYKVLDSKEAVQSHRSIGGTAPGEVKRMIREYTKELEQHKKNLSNRKTSVENAYNKTMSVVSDIMEGKNINDCISFLNE
ncbi:MAG: argininosuccinate lyase [bacterium]|nr:argininosuccinate lyase [bacterium]